MQTLKASKLLLAILTYLHTSLAVANNSNFILAPGYSPLTFSVPKPGSYQLPPLGLATNGQIVNTENKDIQLHDLMGDKVVLLSFIYSTCSDVNGCPLATAVFHKIKKRLKKEPQLSSQLRLLTLSFNPEHDTPKQMKHYAAGLQDSSLDWQFLTTRSEQELQPILQEYRQSIQKIADEQGKFTGTFSHILRVYLIDKKKQLRNIYSVSFLHADTLINDIKTLLIHKTKQPSNVVLKNNSAKQTIKQDHLPPIGLPTVPVPNENPLTEAKIQLGKKLFFDRRLSLNNTFSCAMCHIPDQGFSSNEMKTAVGIEGRTVRRNSPTLYNVAYYQSLFHDGRETNLENQAWGPLLANNEMANPSIGYVINKIKQLAEYQGLFEQAFGRPVGMETMGQAIASYERTLNSANSDFDRWFFAEQTNALNKSAQQGYQLFIGKAQCSSCHTISTKHALFTDNQFHNTGVGYKNSMGIQSRNTQVQLAPGIFIDIDNKIIETVSEEKISDLGRYEITQNPDDRWKYKTPSLRNISLTAPYMHNGSLATLEQVIRFYNQGGFANKTLDSLVKPLNLSDQEITQLVSFLNSLTGDNIEQLISNAH